MYIIQKTVNYDPVYLEKMSEIALEQCEHDKELTELYQEKKRLHFLLDASRILSVCCIAYLTGVLITGPKLVLTLPAVGVLLLILGFLRKAPSLYEKNVVSRGQIIDSYVSPAIQYHHLVSERDLLVCYGRVKDGKFIAFLLALTSREGDVETCSDLESEAARHCLKRISFRYDDANKENGILTLDVGNELVFYS